MGTPPPFKEGDNPTFKSLQILDKKCNIFHTCYKSFKQCLKYEVNQTSIPFPHPDLHAEIYIDLSHKFIEHHTTVFYSLYISFFDYFFLTLKIW